MKLWEDYVKKNVQPDEPLVIDLHNLRSFSLVGKRVFADIVRSRKAPTAWWAPNNDELMLQKLSIDPKTIFTELSEAVSFVLSG